MSPRELDRAMIHAKLRVLRDLLEDLEPLRNISAERLGTERLTRYAVERILTQLVDVAVSVNSHVSAALAARGPADYRESFELAARAGLISEPLARELAPSVGLRNVLTHEYVGVDLAIVAGSIGRAVDGYRRYVEEVARFLRSE
jgi:uncharacterized protein YutE (UPF0331/DUF86 family)